MCTDSVCMVGTADAAPQDNQTRPNLNEAGRELVRALESALIERALSRAKARGDALERRIAALEKKAQGAVKPPVPASISSSKEGELVLVRPVKGVDKEGRLILGDPKLLRADALKS